MKILFITHNTALAGAPKVMLLFLQWLVVHKPIIEIHVLDMAPGSLDSDFKDCSRKYYTFSNDNAQSGFTAKVLKKSGLLGKENDTKTELIHTLAQQNFDMVYANTIKTVPLAVSVKKNSIKTKLILHLHELPTVIKLLLPEFENYIKHIDNYITVSETVKEKLIENYKVSVNCVRMVYAFSEISAIPFSKKNFENFKVGSSGFVDWRKGYDIFIQVARYIKKYKPESDITFTWVGTISKKTQIIVEADLEKLGLQGKVSFVGVQGDPWSYYKEFDIFILPSREDPFPLVCIEMAMLKKPILCFKDVVGTAEILKHGGGKVIPYLDIEAMAKAIVDYYEDRNHLEEDGERASQLFAQFTPINQCPKLFSIIEESLNDIKI
ncbi:glycosyltransferase [Marixanthomonas sp. SCSIO 43207]|uniref:glycosyltransferase n=1 Tax=Marixanthomonas sp. SCSIO 43207 TaxID=2779360 RepID=UPI001CA90AC1|nr:glycosyltransferase [Marixanthomonas sp. SCSIO 43207]UAB81229.1 glycosyltransferase [Marixanthomonas sp. SCSIO 43207]